MLPWPRAMVAPVLSSASTAAELREAASNGPRRPGWGAEAEGCVMHLNANQPRRDVSPESRLPSRSDTRAAQPVQHLSAFIFISRGAASCHYPATSTNRTAVFVCTNAGHWMFSTVIVLAQPHCCAQTHTRKKKCSLETSTQTPSNVRCSPQSSADEGD